MKDERKTKAKLVEELSELRKRVQSMETAEREHKETEKALRESEARYRHIFENSPFGIGIADLEGNVLDCNRAIESITGYTKRALKRINLADTYVNAEDRAALLKALKKDGVVTDYPLKLKRKDGTPYDALLNVALMRIGDKDVFHTVQMDVTERKLAEDKLRESEERFRGLFDNTVIGFYRTTPDGRVLMANPALVRMLGYSSFDELAQRNLEEGWHEPEYPRNEFKERIEKKDKLIGLESAWRKRDGAIVYVRESAVARRDDTGSILYYEGTVEDFTERKRVEDALRESEERYRHIFESSPHGIGISDLDGNVLDGNRAMENITGYTLKELKQISLLDTYAKPEDRAAFLKALRKDGAVTDYLMKLKRKNGTPYDALLSVAITKVGDKDVMHTVCQDFTERKRAEEALRESETKYQDLYNNAPVACFSIGTDGFIIDANREAEKFIGFQLEELLGMSVVDLYADESQTRARRLLDKLRRSDSWENKEVVYRRKDEQKRYGLLSVSPVKGKDGQVVESHSVVVDITERKQTEQALRESEERYRDLFEYSALPIVRTSKDAQIIAANQAFSELIGYSREETLDGLAWSDILPEGANDAVMAMHKSRREGSPPESYEATILTKAGGRRLVAISSRLVPGTDEDIAIIQDITERKRGEEALQESRERYIALFEQAAESIVVIDAETGALVEFNDRAHEALGYTREEFGKLKLADIEVTESTAEVAEHLNKIIKTGFDEFETKQRAKSGEIRDIQVSSKAITVKGSNYLQSIWRDITDSKRAELQLEASRQQLRALSARVLAAQEEERTRISREIHDELAQALTTLTFDLAWLGNKLPEEDVAVQNKVMTMNQRIGETIKAVQRISAELRPGMLDDLGLVAAVEWYLTDFQERTGIKCDLRIEPEDFTLSAGRSTTAFRIFQEALTNIARYASATNVKVKLQKRKGRLLLEVRDDGRGITAEQAASNKSLGLTGMRERARLWNGSVTIKGTEGKGTAVLVEIPLDEPSADRDTR